MSKIETFIIDSSTGEKIIPYDTTNNYNIYFFQKNTSINIKFNTTVVGKFIVVGPGGDGNPMQSDTNWQGSGGIGSPYVFNNNFTFYGSNYQYEITVPDGTIPNLTKQNYSSKTSLVGPNINCVIEASSYPQKSVAYLNGNNVMIHQNGGEKSFGNYCNPGEPQKYEPITIGKYNFWLGGGGSGGNTKTSGSYHEHGGKSGRGYGAGQLDQPCNDCNRECYPGDNARYITNWVGTAPLNFVIPKIQTQETTQNKSDQNKSAFTKSLQNIVILVPPTDTDIFAGNGGGGGGRNKIGGSGSPGLIVIAIPVQYQQTLTFSEMGYSNYNNLMGKALITSDSENSNLRQSNFYCPSIDNKTCYNDVSKLNYPPINPISELNCNATFDANNINKTFTFVEGVNSIEPSICKKIYENYNLYPTTNPLVVVGNNPNSSITNNILNNSELTSIASQNSNIFTNINTTTDIINSINNVLEETPLKLACCKRSQNDTTSKSTNVKTSLSPYVASENPLLSNLNYQNKIFTIPENSCPVNLYKGSENCNAFFSSYCANLYDYLDSKGLSNNEKLLQIPECACYFPKTKEQQFYPAGTPSICFKDGCNSSVAYLDPSSIKPDGSQVQCDMTVCQNIVNTAGLTAGGSANVSPVLENNCGQYLPQESDNTVVKDNPQNQTNLTNQANLTNQTNLTNQANLTNQGNLTNQANIPSSSSQSNSLDNNSVTIIIVIIIFIILILLGIIIYYSLLKKK